LPDAVVDPVQAEPLGHRRETADVLHPQPGLVLAHHDEAGPLPSAHRTYVAKRVDFGGRHDAAVTSGTHLGEAVGRPGGVQPDLLARRARLVLLTSPARQVTVPDHCSPPPARTHSSRSGSYIATNRSDRSRPR